MHSSLAFRLHINMSFTHCITRLHDLILVKISCLLRSNGFNRIRMELRKQALPFLQCSNIEPWSVCIQTISWDGIGNV